MKRLLISVAFVALVGFVPTSADAQCAFDDFDQADDFHIDMVRSYSVCPTSTFPSPNSSTGTGVPSCSPPFAHSRFLSTDFASGCDFDADSALEDPCSDGSGDPCTNVELSARCRGILESDGVTETESSGWSFTAVSRATIADPDNGDMTVIDFPIVVPFPQANGGRIGVSTDSNAVLASLGLPALPACATIEIVSLSIKDPDGNPFATRGIGNRF